MAVLQSLRETPGALVRNPVLLVPVFVLMLFQVPQLVLQIVSPLLASLVSLLFSLLFVFLVPFFQAGLIGMADEALDGSTSLSTFVREGKENYLSVFGAYLLLVAGNFLLGIVFFVVAIVGGIAAFGAGSGSNGSAGMGIVALAIVGVVMLLAALAYLLVVFFIQFYGQAIVLDDLGAVAGLKRSASVVRGRLVSTLGYSLLVAVLGGLIGGGFGYVSALAATSSMAGTTPMITPLDPTVLILLAVLVVAVGTLFGSFLGVFSVSFYRSIRE